MPTVYIAFIIITLMLSLVNLYDMAIRPNGIKEYIFEISLLIFVSIILIIQIVVFFFINK